MKKKDKISREDSSDKNYFYEDSNLSHSFHLTTEKTKEKTDTLNSKVKNKQKFHKNLENSSESNKSAPSTLSIIQTKEKSNENNLFNGKTTADTEKHQIKGLKRKPKIPDSENDNLQKKIRESLISCRAGTIKPLEKINLDFVKTKFTNFIEAHINQIFDQRKLQETEFRKMINSEYFSK